MECKVWPLISTLCALSCVSVVVTSGLTESTPNIHFSSDVLSQLVMLQERMLQQERANYRLASIVAEQSEKITVLENSRMEDKEYIASLEVKLEQSNLKHAHSIAELKADLKRPEKGTTMDETLDHTINQQTVSSLLNSNDAKVKTVLSVSESGSETMKENTITVNTSNPLSSQQKHVFPRSDDDNPLLASLAHVTQRVDNMAAKMAALESSQQASNTAISDAASSMFTRWGGASCGDHAVDVYTGTVGGSHFSNTGSAVNYLCLPPNPVLSSHANPGPTAYLYGGEYQTYDDKADQDAVCSVCRAGFATTVMTPATNVCPPGWTKQYSGYLMAGYYGHTAGSEFICVDSAFDIAVHGDRDEDGKLLYFTQTACGSLPCGPYLKGKIVTCVVCSK